MIASPPGSGDDGLLILISLFAGLLLGYPISDYGAGEAKSEFTPPPQPCPELEP